MYNAVKVFVKVENIGDIIKGDIIKVKPDAYGYATFKSMYGTDYAKITKINENVYKPEDSVILIVGCDENGVIPNPANPATGRILFKHIDTKAEQMPEAAAAAGGANKGKSKTRKYSKSKSKSKSQNKGKNRSRSSKSQSRKYSKSRR
jgi:hypothetical protein